MEKSKSHRLELFWNCFLKCDNEYNKQNYLELFLYEYYKSEGKVPAIAEKNSLLSSVPSQLSCHVLQMIYSTICTSINDECAKDFDTDFYNKINDVCYDKNIDGYFKRNLLKKSSEQKHIISLREFLLSGTGGRILETLQCVGISNIPCGRELSNLLINLFPSASWNDSDANDDSRLNYNDSIDFIELINKVLLYDVANLNSNAKRTSTNDDNFVDDSSKFLQNFDEYDILNENILTDITNYNYSEFVTDDFKLYLKRKIPSKYFSKILINLLISIAQDENLTIIDKSSSTIQSLHFAIEKLNFLKLNPNIFNNTLNCELIRAKLLILFIISLNNIFLLKNKVSSNLIDLKLIVKKLVEILEHDILNPMNNNTTSNLSANDLCLLNSLEKDIVFGIYYFIFIIINNSIVLNIDLDYEYIVNLISQFDKNQLTKSVFDLFNNNNDNNKNFYSNKIINILIKIILNIKSLLNFNLNETNLITQKPNNNNNNKLSKYKNDWRSQNFHHYHHNTNSSSNNFYNLKCELENLLLNLICYDLPIDSIKLILKYFQRYGFCCCNCNINIINILFNLIGNNTKLLSIVLIFLKNNIIKTMLNTRCDICLNKIQYKNINSNLIQKQLINNYINLINNLNEKHIYVVLEHLSKLQIDRIPDELSLKFIFQVTHPIFEKYRKQLLTKEYNDIVIAKQLICSCLNIFSNYLNDNEKLINIFFTNDLVESLNELIIYYELVPNIFRLIKIGLLNLQISNLNEILYKDLLMLPIESTINITKKVIQIFNKLNMINDNHHFRNTRKYQSKNHIIRNENDNNDNMNILYELRLAAVYWNMTLQLLQTNDEFKNVFKLKFNSIHQDTTLIYLVYNILNFILNLNEANINNTSDCSKKINFDKIIDETDLYSKICCDELYDIYNKDDLYNINSLLNINDINIRLILYQYMELNENDNFLKIKSSLVSTQFYENYETIIKYYELIQIKENYKNINDDYNGRDCQYKNITTKTKPIYNLKNNNKINNKIKLTIKYNGNDSSINNINLKNDNSETIIGNVIVSVSKIHKLLWKYFTNDQEESLTDEYQENDGWFSKEEIAFLYSAECKKICFQLFEIILSVVLVDLSDKKMLSALEEIKKLLIRHGNGYWDSIDNGTAILNVLQSLLRISKCRNDENTNSLKQDGIDCPTKNDWVNDIDSLSTDMDCSDEDNLSGADEGYEADAENYNLSETETNSQDLMKIKPISPVSNFRTCIIHNGVSKLIIEILFEFCNRCTDEPTFWPAILNQILTRLAVIRDSLGGSMFLLQGFHKVLIISDDRLIDIQRSVLELITNLNTPEALSEYLKLFASKNPPINLLLPRLCYLINSLKIEPAVEITFPCFTNEPTILSCDVENNEEIEELKTLYSSHKAHQINSGLSESKFIIPINNGEFKPWNSNGFTVTTWIKCFDIESSRVKSSFENSFTNDKEMVHLFSLGNKNLLLSIYLSNNDGNVLSIHLTRPNEELNDSKMQKKSNNTSKKNSPESDQISINTSNNTNSDSLNANGKKKRFRKFKSTALSQGLNIILDNRNGNFLVDKQTTESINKNDSMLSNTIKNTKTILKNSLMNFQLFSPKPSKTCFDEIKPIEIQNLKLPKNKWIHLCFSVEIHDNGITLQITMDGTENEKLRIYLHQDFLRNIRKNKSTVFCIGSNRSSEAQDDLTATKQIGYKLSNLILFKETILDFSVLATLTSLGPDFVNFNYTMASNIIPNMSLLNNNKIVNIFDLNACDSIKILQNLLIGIYSAHEPNKFLAYDFNKSDRGERIHFITCGLAMKPNYIASIQSATILSGGVSPIIMLFGRVVELSNCAFLQSTSLQLVLKIIFSHVELYTEFIKCGGISMMGSIIRTKNCIKNLDMLRSIIETACEGAILSKKLQNEKYQIISQTNACIVHSELLISIIVRYWDWYDPREKDSDVLDVLFGIFLALVREKHPHHAINVYRLTKAGIIPALLNFCKIYLVGASRSVFISKYAAENLVNLVRVFAGAPPLPSLLDDIIKLLILMHRPSDSFVTHDRSKFYFLLTPSVPNKQKRIILPSVPSKMYSNHHYHHGPNKMRERKLTLPVSSISPRSLMRSMSFNYGTAYHDESWSTILDVSSHPDNSDNEVVDQREEVAIGTVETEHKFSPNKEVDLYQCRSNNSIITKLYTKKHKKIKKIIYKKTSPKKTSPATKLHKHHKKKSKHQHYHHRSSLTRFHHNTSELETNLKTSASECRLNTTIFNELSNSNDLFKAYKSPGFIRVQECFFNLLRDFILILPDNSIDEVLNHYVTIEILIVLSNHSDVNIRTAIVNLLSIICDRLPTTVLAQHTKNYSWFHLGNQVSLNIVDDEFLNACIQFITGNCLNYEEIMELEEINIGHKGGLNLLIAALYETVHDQELAMKTVNVIELLYTKVQNGAVYMIENGLIYSIVKTLIKSYTEEQFSPNAMRLDRIFTLLTTIAFQSFTSSGAMTVLWDILNCLTFVEHVKVDYARIGARNAQAKILNYIIDACTTSHTNPTSILNFKIKNSKIVIPKCNLSSTELKTRFDLILDRSVQFITHAELTYQPTDTEIKLIFQIIDLSLNGYVRCCNNVVLWALCPSRQQTLTISIIRLLSKIKNLNKLNCDIKTIKIFSQSFLLANHNVLNENDLKMITDFNNSLEGPTNSSWNLKEILTRMEIAREMTWKELKPSTDRAVYKMESIATICIESAMKITRNVVELQNVERRFLMNHMRSDDDKETIMKWHMVIQNMTHEGAPWCFDSDYPSCWELDHTEGPNRVLLRFKRCHSNIESKFFLEDYQKINNGKHYKLLQYLMTSISEQCNFCANDQVLHNFNVKHLSIDCEVDGELIVTESQIIFMPSRNVNEPILYDIISITEIWTRRYQHNDVALELFLDTGNTMFIIMNSSNDRETLEKYFSDKIVSSPDINKLSGIIQQWKEGQLTNWEYLILLNQMSGRTYHDLMQYPVFPWILSDYENIVLDLTSPNSFRILDKPIAIQHNSNEAHYINNYEYLSQSAAGTGHLEPYHYGSHYSNSGTVLHFLVRLLPFTKLFLHYQDNSFDIPDRTFHAVKTTWRLASKDSPTDVKELIPQFFSLPEMFENNEGFNFGVRQSGESVNNVILPQWCENSPRLFTLIHRQALESDVVRKNLNHWIDLIFGYKQDGQPAIDAINVFHPATYYGFSCNNMSDPVEKMACETMVKTYGQMPRKLFKSPHSTAQIIPTKGTEVEVLPSVKGLKWGTYTGSPSLPNPVLCTVMQETDNYTTFLSLENTNVIYAVPEKCNIMQGIEQDTMNLISWNEYDNVVRIKPLCDINVEPKILINISRVDPITACGTNINSNQLWFGHNSGRITVYYCTGMSTSSKYNKNRLFQHANFTKLSYNSAFRKVSGKLISRPLELDLVNSVNSGNQSTKWHGPFNLIRHTDKINVIKISVDFKIAVSAGRDGLAVIWDINRLQYIRVIETSSCLNIPEIYLTEISSTLGDIITVHDVTKTIDHEYVDDDEDESFEVTETNIDDFVKISMNLRGNCIMRLHTVNGKYVNHVLLQEKIASLCFSNIKEGTGVNVILTGMQNGIIKFWSSWNLCFMKEVYTGPSDVISLTYSTYQHLVVLNNNNIIQVWESPGLNGSSPKIYFLKDNKNV